METIIIVIEVLQLGLLEIWLFWNLKLFADNHIFIYYEYRWIQ